MGGTINFNSKLGVGTCFYVDFQVSNETEQKVSAPVKTEIFELKKIENGERKFCVLYIEDNEVNTQLVQKVLGKNRPSVKLVCTDHAREGIELAVKIQPDLILMDIQLPDIDGIQAFKKLQTFKETRGVPVIALSANAMKHQVEDVMSLGFIFYLTKPINIKLFLEKIDQYC